MVNTGRPSTGCALCRKRRVKCDEARPNCNRCTKIGVTCSGYRSSLDAVFKDATAKFYQQPLAMAPLIRRPIELEAKQAFIHKFQHQTAFISLEMSGLLLQTIQKSRDESALSTAASSVGLLLMTRQYHDSAMVARRSYGTALSRTMTDLGDRRRSAADETLMAVLMLLTFETMLGPTNSSLESTARHVYGLAAILQARGNSSFDHPPGRYMFYQLRDFILLSCIQYGVAAPKSLSSLNHKSFDHFDRAPKRQIEPCLDDFAGIMRQLCLICAGLKMGTLKDGPGLTRAASELDDILAQWAANLPPDFDTTIIDEGFDSFPPSRIIYKTPSIARHFTSYCCARIIANEIIYGNNPPPKIALMLQDLGIHIFCALLSFVQQFGDCAIGTCGRLPHWSLYVAGSMSAASEKMRNWAILRLNHIKQAAQVLEAGELADALLSGDHSKYKYWIKETNLGI